jgi:glycine/D-amino acid oxidase-like deaminating enzyme
MSKDIFPVNDSCRSYWMSSSDNLVNHRSTVDLPVNSDIVIIGSGYAGSACAYYLYKHQYLNQNPLTITMLEARETCSGATGRNGGHLKPDVYYSYKRYSDKYGRETAETLMEFEAKHIDEMSKLISEENIECDWTVTRACDAYIDPEIAEQAKTSYQQRCDDGGNVSDIHEIPSDDLLSVTRVKNVLYGITFTGATLHPYKLIHHLLNKCVQRGMNLQTNTSVLNATRLPSGHWSIVTSRGSIEASKVIFATNGYTAGIVPLLHNKIIPVRGTVCRILPSTNYMLKPLEMSYSIRSKGNQFDYMIARQTGDRSIILGGAKPTYLSDKDTWYNNWDDRIQFINDKSKRYFEEFMPKHFDKWEMDHSGCKQMWTGILGYTSDLLPFVGELPDQSNGYVIAGFNAQGMPRILLCARALVDLVLQTVDNIKQTIPEPYLITKDRLQTKENSILKHMTGHLHLQDTS